MKALATSQMILLVLAIIVLAVIAYLVYTQYIAGSNQFGATNCQSAIVSACTNCRTCLTGFGQTWGTGPPTSTFLGPCPHGTFNSCDKLCGHPTNCNKNVGDTGVCKDYVDFTECSSVGTG